MLGLLMAAIIATAVSGSSAHSGSSYLEHSTAPLLTTWHHWFASDALGIITVAPLLIGIAAAVRDPPPRSELVEGSSALVVLTVMGGARGRPAAASLGDRWCRSRCCFRCCCGSRRGAGRCSLQPPRLSSP